MLEKQDIAQKLKGPQPTDGQIRKLQNVKMPMLLLACELL